MMVDGWVVVGQWISGSVGSVGVCVGSGDGGGVSHEACGQPTAAEKHTFERARRSEWGMLTLASSPASSVGMGV
jgi:hypothetical protein